MVIRGLQWLLLLLLVPAKVFMADGEIDLDPCRAFHAGSVPGQRIVVTMDLYHHKAPEDLPAEKQPAVFRGNLGRYTWCDRHVNGFSALRLLLWQQGYLTRNLRQKITPATLNGTDILVIQNPDSKAYWDEVVPIAAEEIAAVVEFVRQGGRLLVMANSSPDSRGKEPYDRDSLNRLGSPFGVYLEQKDSGDVKIPVPDSHRYLGGVKYFQYGQGCTMALSARTGVRQEVILTYQNEPIIVLAQLGLGKALFVGDVSSLSNQPLNRIGVDNVQAALRLFELLKPDRSGRDKGRGSIRVGKRFHKSTVYHHSAVRHVKVIQNFDHPLKANPSIEPREKYRWMELERTLKAEVGDAREFPYPWILERPLEEGNYQLGMTWKKPVKVRILPLEMNLSPRFAHVEGLWTVLGVHKVNGQSHAQLHVTAVVPLAGKPLDLLLSFPNQTINATKTIEESAGNQYFEAFLWVDVETGTLLKAHYENTGYLWFRLNFTPFKALPRLGPAITQETGDIY